MSEVMEPGAKQQIWCFVNLSDVITATWIGAAKRMAPSGLKIVFKSVEIRSLISKPPIHLEIDQNNEVCSVNFTPAVIVTDLHGTGTLANAISLPHAMDQSNCYPDSNRPIFIAWLSNTDSMQRALLMEMGYDFVVERPSEISRIVPKLIRFGYSSPLASHPWLEDDKRAS